MKRIRNVVILKFGIVDNGLTTLTIIVLGFTVGISSWFIWVSGILPAFFCIAFVMLIPRE